MFEQNLTYRGNLVYTSKRVVDICGISDNTLSNYLISQNPLLKKR